MADYKKIIEISADIRPAKKAFQDLEAIFSASDKKLESSLSAAMYAAVKTIKPQVNELFAAFQEKRLANLLGDPAKITDAIKRVEDAKRALDSSSEGAAFVRQLEEAEAIARHSEMIDFAGLRTQQKEIDKLKDAMSSGTLKLTPEQASDLTKALQDRQTILDEIAAKQLELNRLEMLDNKETEEKQKLLQEINALKAKIEPEKSSSLALASSKATPKKTDLSRVLTALITGKAGSDKDYDTVGGKILGNVSATFSNAMMKAIKNIGKFFVDTFKQSFEKLKEMAAFDAGTTLYSDSTKRERQLTFGLTGAQNYAMTNAMQMLGMKDINDLMWANANQKSEYNRLTAILEEQYNKLEATGIFATAQQFQLDMSLMKLQFQNTVYQFIAAHKSQLETVLNMSLKFMEGVLNFLGVIVDGISSILGNNYASSDALAAASTTNNSSTDNSRTITATVNYTNNQGGQDSQSVLSESVLNQLITILNA